MTPPQTFEALPDLTLAECCDRWEVSSRNTIKARAAALGVVLRRESSTRTVWPAEALALGDRLAEHLRQPGGTLANFPEAVPSLASPAAISDGSQRGGGLSVTAPAGGTDTMAALLQLMGGMAPPPPAPDPLAVSRGLAEAADLAAWLSPVELARLLGVAPGTVRSWSTGHRPRPGFELERRKDGSSVWWRVTDSTD